MGVALAPQTGACGHNRAMAKLAPRLSPAQIAEVIKTAWDDQPPFNKVLTTHGLLPGQVIALLKRELTPSAYKTWQARSGGGPARRPRR